MSSLLSTNNNNDIKSINLMIEILNFQSGKYL
jgi:hypothetical protein